MLTLTENASTIVRDITRNAAGNLDDQRGRPGHEGQPDGAGLRITSDGDESSFAIGTAEAAEPADQVVEQDGATIYLDRQAADLLDDKILDAVVDDAGRVEFALTTQQ